MKSNTNLVNYLVRNGALKSKNIIDCFYKIDRKDFVTFEEIINAYIDSPLGIGYGQTISQPTTVAFMLELLGPKSGENILDIGSGSGWTTALLGCMVGTKGQVLGLERVDELVDFGNDNISKYKLNNVQIKKAGGKLGVPGEQFDKILVSAASETFPEELVNQLTKGGIIVIPIQNSIFKIEKETDGNISMIEYPNFIFVPLIYDI